MCAIYKNVYPSNLNFCCGILTIEHGRSGRAYDTINIWIRL